jgi:uncharacterized protein (TIGR03437 family)
MPIPEHNYRSLFLVILVVLAGLMSNRLTAATPQIGGGSCSTGMVNGTYFYVLAGTVASGGQGVPYAELGGLVADGSGHVSGQSFATVNGQSGIYSLAGTYSVQSNCTGSISLTVNSQQTTILTFQIIDNAQAMIVAISNSDEIVVGRAYRQTAGGAPLECNNGSLSGTYGYLLSGFAAVSGQTYGYSDSGQVLADGNGNLTTQSIANVGGTVSNMTGNGTYSVSSDCHGTASITSSAGTSNYVFAIVQDGTGVLFVETDSGFTVGGTGQPQFSPSAQSVVNGASFQSQAVAPGSLFSIFGTGLSSQSASAQTIPLPSTIGQTQVLVNGKSAPVLYVSNSQINAQMPVGVPTGQPVSVTVTNADAPSNTVTLKVPVAAPGLFTYSNNRAIVQNPNGSLNSPSSPAHAGDVLVAYLTGGGAVNSSDWTTGAASPNGASSVTASYNLTVGNEPAQVAYVGLTPGFVGLYQANFTLPSLAPGQYPIVLTVGGNPSNGAMLSVGD